MEEQEEEKKITRILVLADQTEYGNSAVEHAIFLKHVFQSELEILKPDSNQSNKKLYQYLSIIHLSPHQKFKFRLKQMRLPCVAAALHIEVDEPYIHDARALPFPVLTPPPLQRRGSHGDVHGVAAELVIVNV